MKRVLLFAAASALFLPALAAAAEISAYGTTMFLFSQQSTPGFAKQDLYPATQYLGMNATGLADGNLSLNFYGWGRVDLGDRSSNDKSTDGMVSSAYLRYLLPKADGEIKAGRFTLLEGVAHELVDGFYAAVDTPVGLRIALFGGQPSQIGLENDKRGDWLAGSRVSYHVAGKVELGVSFLHAGNSPSQELSAGMPLPLTIRNEREVVGGDLWLSPVDWVTLSGRTSYNTVTSGFAENDYTLTFRPLKKITVSGNYTERNTKDLYSGTNLPSLFRPDNADRVRNIGGAVTLAMVKPLSITIDYRHSKRSSYGNTDRYGAEMRLSAEKLISGGIGYHYVSAATTTPTGLPTPVYDPSYQEVRLWIAHDIGVYYASFDAIGHFYKDSNNPDLNGKSSLFELVASTGFRPSPNLKISGDVSYGENSLNRSEFKGLVRAEFNISSANGRSK